MLGHRIDVVRHHGAAARGLALARPALEWLRDQLCGAVYLARYVDGEIVVTEIVDSPRAPRIDLWVGVHDAGHATALGKCILGQLPPADRDDYLGRHPLHDLTPRTVVDRRRLRLPGAGRGRRRRRRVRGRGLLPRRRRAARTGWRRSAWSVPGVGGCAADGPGRRAGRVSRALALGSGAA